MVWYGMVWYGTVWYGIRQRSLYLSWPDIDADILNIYAYLFVGRRQIFGKLPSFYNCIILKRTRQMIHLSYQMLLSVI